MVWRQIQRSNKLTANLSEGQFSVAESFKNSLEVSLTTKPVEMEPSPHFYGHDAFEPGLYSRIRQHLPQSEHYGGIGARTSNKRARKTRLVLPMVPDNLSRLPGPLKSFWEQATNYFTSAEFLRLALTSYQPMLARLRPDLINHDQFNVRFELLRDTTAYGIGPHSDNPKKVMTLLFYLSGGELSESLGTSFYLPNEVGFSCKKGIHYDYDKFTRLKTCPYAPNTILSFLRTDTSFHGVEVIKEENVQRDVLRWMLWKQ